MSVFKFRRNAEVVVDRARKGRVERRRYSGDPDNEIVQYLIYYDDGEEAGWVNEGRLELNGQVELEVS